MRRSIALLFGCMMLAGCSAEPDPRGVDRKETLLQVSATGRADNRPDEALFSAGVNALGGTAGEATAQNNARMQKVVAAIEGLGIQPADIQTRNISLEKIEYGRDAGKYRASNIVEVRVRKVDQASAAVAAATEAGANTISGPNFRVSNREAASRSAYAEAYKAARARAEAYAQAAGMKVSRVLAIREAGAQVGPPPPYADAVGMAVTEQVSAPPIRPGLNASEVQIRVDFALAE